MPACLAAAQNLIKNKLLYDLVDYVVTMDKADKRYKNGNRIELGGGGKTAKSTLEALI